MKNPESPHLNLNIRLLRRVQQKAIKLPKTFRMGEWGFKVARDKEHPCGAVGCIAGNAALLADPEQALYVMENTFGGGGLCNLGRQVLGLTYVQEHRLFYVQGWPERFRKHYENAQTPRGQARAIYNRIEHFIKTKGAE